MKKLIAKCAILVIPMVFFMLVSCQNEEIGETVEERSENFVSLDMAILFASVLEYPNDKKSKNNKVDGRSSIFKDVEEVFEVPGERGMPSYYIINYKHKGFVVISGDNRTNPIQAFSSTDNFPLDAADYPGGLIDWLDATNSKISDIRSSSVKQTEAMAKFWDICEMQKTIQSVDEGDCNGGGEGGGCENLYTTVGPLMSTVWGQRATFNDLVQNENCTSSTTPTGCVATAMAQVMNYHEFPNNYVWNDMPDDNIGTMEIARLMRDIGEEVNMDYSCTGSGAHMKDAASAFSGDFGYQSVNYTEFNQTTVKQQLGWDRPVILSGYNKKEKNCFLFFCSTKHTEGHAWVCDGYKSNFYCEAGVSYLYLHMNWGWGGFLNGWFGFNTWNPDGDNYQYKKEMIYNIRP